jgi:RNA polymerase sigma factor (sigma-70 family)
MSVVGGSVVRSLERLFGRGVATGLSESQLLERFVSNRDELAFEMLVCRHGPMVLGVCRRFLHDPNDVDDAFQATFLILVRKAGSLRHQDLLGNWLYGVAYRVANRARVLAARREARFRTADSRDVEIGTVEKSKTDAADAASQSEASAWLLEEVHRLPESYRVPLVLCYFEGLTHEAAAERLGWPLGTVKGRLARARERLRIRLTRRGLALSATSLVSQLSNEAQGAIVSPPLLRLTIQTGLAAASQAGRSLVTLIGISLPVLSLSQGVLRTMALSQIQSLALPLLLAVGLASTGATVVAYQAEPSSPASPADSPVPAPALAVALQDDVATTSDDAPNDANNAQVSKEDAEQPASDSAQSDSAQPKKAPNRPAQGTSRGRMRGMMGQMGGGMGGMGGMGMGGMQGMMPGMMMAAGGGDAGSIRMANGNFLTESQARVEIASLAAFVAENDQSPQTQSIIERLNEPITMSFSSETPLEDVLKYIKQATSGKDGQTPIPIYVDPIGLQEQDRTMTSTVLIDLDGVPLKTSLRLLLKQLNMAYCVHDGVLIISSVAGIVQELEEAKRELQPAGPPGTFQ